jgi:hypothetical protein
MKKWILTLLYLGVVTLTYCQTGNKTVFDAWPALKAFHGVMSQTFHPSEEGNLDPIRERINEFCEKADALATSEIPSDVNTDKVKKAVSDLRTGSIDLKRIISAKAGDAEIKAKLSALHDVFHQIVGLCRHSEQEKH